MGIFQDTVLSNVERNSILNVIGGSLFLFLILCISVSFLLIFIFLAGTPRPSGDTLPAPNYRRQLLEVFSSRRKSIVRPAIAVCIVLSIVSWLAAFIVLAASKKING